MQVTAPLFSSRLFDYGPEEGDEEVPGGTVDIGKKLRLSHPITFLGRQHSVIYILSNGGIGFDTGARQYKADIFADGPELIAPY